MEGTGLREAALNPRGIGVESHELFPRTSGSGVGKDPGELRGCEVEEVRGGDWGIFPGTTMVGHVGPSIARSRPGHVSKEADGVLPTRDVLLGRHGHGGDGRGPFPT